MGAIVLEETIYTAYCEACDWESRTFDNREAAADEARQHECLK